MTASPAKNIPHSWGISRWKATCQAKKNSIEFTGLRGNFLDLESQTKLKMGLPERVLYFGGRKYTHKGSPCSP